VCFAISLLFSLPMIRLDFNPYDGGLIVLGAEQVLKGRWPLIDFYAPYPPGAFFVLAALFKLTGISILAERGLTAVLVALALAFAYPLVAPSSNRLLPFRLFPLRPLPFRLLPFGLTVVPLAVVGLFLSSTWVTPQVAGALMLLMMSANVLVRAVPNASVKGAAGTGVLLGLAALWRADLAFYGAVAAWVTWLLLAGGGRFGSQRLIGAMTMSASALGTAGPVFGLFLFLGGTRAFDSLFIHPFYSTYHATLPWPAMWQTDSWQQFYDDGLRRGLGAAFSGWRYYFPFVAAAGVMLQLTRSTGRTDAFASARIWLLLTAVGFGVYASGRTDTTHIIPLVFVSGAMAALVLGASGLFQSANGLFQCRCSRLSAVIVAASTLAMVPVPLHHNWVMQGVERVDVPFGRGLGMRAERSLVEKYTAIVATLNQGTPTSPVYIGTSRHDVFVLNDSMLYFLAERNPATYYWCLDSAVTTSASVQLEMVAELRTGGVERIVLLSGDPINDAHPVPGSRELDKMLRATFPRHLTDIGNYSLWQRGPVPAANP
jgi:hypothetical protein